MRRRWICSPAVLLVSGALASPVCAQRPDTAVTRDSSTLAPLVITATRTPSPLLTTPVPVTVIDSAQLTRRQPNNAAELFFEYPGLDASGVGPNQGRPVIRGQLGQRILLMEDGLRLNNTRRQTNFGELPALVAVEDIARIEIVRGSASVLYGTDAIGGVVNLITRQPLQGIAESELHGTVGLRYSGSDAQTRPWGDLLLRSGRLSISAFGAWREASDYAAPSGSFGGLTAAGALRVHDTGIRDQNYDLQLRYSLAAHAQTFIRYERYHADTAGFGYVDNAAINRPDLPYIRITYPAQSVDRLTGGYLVGGLTGLPLDRLAVTAYVQGNDRYLNQDVFAPFGGGAPPGSGVQVNTRNFTDVKSWGFRIEAAKTLSAATLMTYGIDGFQDRTANSDTNVTQLVGVGPSPPDTSTVPQLPYAEFRSLGAFVQLQVRPIERLSLVAGVRGQDTRAATRPTPGLALALISHEDQTVVGAINASYRLTSQLSLVGSVGRGFRSPNLIERFFEGPTPEGNAYQVRTPDLRPEQSLSLDAGLRWWFGGVRVEAFVFLSDITDGIVIVARGDTVQGLPAYENRNIGKLRYSGVELAAEVPIALGLSIGGNYSHVGSQDRLDATNPIAASYADKVVGRLQYTQPAGRFWAAWVVRHNGEEKDLGLGQSPVGPVWPSFTVQALRAGLVLFRAGRMVHQATLAVSNLANALYSEPTNASLFRPAPGRSAALTYRIEF